MLRVVSSAGLSVQQQPCRDWSSGHVPWQTDVHASHTDRGAAPLFSSFFPLVGEGSKDRSLVLCFALPKRRQTSLPCVLAHSGTHLGEVRF